MNTSTLTRLGRYEVIEELGRGAMGVVYKARDPQIDRLVAIKTISVVAQDLDDETAFRERFFLEAKAAGRLSHPGIVQIFDVGEGLETRTPYIVMELISGQSLNKVLVANGSRLATDTALLLAQEVAAALGYAHSQGVIHRDIKPANIMVTEEGRAKIADFGIAKLDLSAITIPGETVGSPAYMAPEQLTGAEVDGRADLFSLGVILYTALTGHRPFQGQGNSTVRFKVAHQTPVPATSLNFELPSEINDVLARALAKDPEQRYSSGSEMAHDIQRLREQIECGEISPFFVGKPLRTPSKLVDEPTASPNDGAIDTTPVAATANVISGSAVPRPQPAAQIERRWPKRWLMMASFIFAAVVLALIAQHKIRAATVPPGSTSDTSVVTGEHDPASFTGSESIRSSIASSIESGRTRASSHQRQAVLDPPKPGKSATIAAKPPHASLPQAVTALQVEPSPAGSTLPAAGATLVLDVEHTFDQAQITIWVDNRLAYHDALYGGVKKTLGMFSRTQGKYSNRVSVTAGEHTIRVRAESVDGTYDESRLISAGFAKDEPKTLHVKCDKRKRDLQLRFD